MKKIIAILVAASLAACSVGSRKSNEFLFACTKVNAEFSLPVNTCEYTPPQVVVSYVVPPNLYGVYYGGEPYIFIQPDALVSIASVEVHETVHYLLNQARPYLSKCASEGAARRITADYENVEYDDTWRQYYGC